MVYVLWTQQKTDFIIYHNQNLTSISFNHRLLSRSVKWRKLYRLTMFCVKKKRPSGCGRQNPGYMRLNNIYKNMFPNKHSVNWSVGISEAHCIHLYDGAYLYERALFSFNTCKRLLTKKEKSDVYFAQQSMLFINNNNT